jgi:hypothetical protein
VLLHKASQQLFSFAHHEWFFSDDEYLHLPDIRTADGILDLISGCTLAILGNVLDFRTYCAANQAEAHTTTQEQGRLWRKFDRNNIPGDERMAICYTRGLALQVFSWIRQWCIIKTPDGEIIDDLPSKYMVELLDALVAYKSKATTQKMSGAPHCALWMLKAQISNVVECDRSVEKLWKQKKDTSSHSLGTTLVKGCTVEWSDGVPISLNAIRKFFSFKPLLWNSVFPAKRRQIDGMTAFDRKFLEGERLRRQFELKAAKA